MEFDPFSSDFFDDPYETYRWLRDHAPVYRNERYGFWALSRYDDVVAAHRDWETFSSSHGVTIDQLIDERRTTVDESIIFLDPPEHERLRRLVSRVFTPKAMADLEPLVRTLVRGHADAIGDATSFDLVADLAAPFPVEVISTILGVPEPDRQQIRHWADEMLRREPDNPQPTQAGMEAGLHMIAYLLDLTAEKRAHPTDDMLSQLILADVPDDDGGTYRLTDGEVASFGTLLAAAGSETVTKLIGSGAVLFAQHPDQWEKVLADPDALGGAIEEILRYWAPSQYQGRFTHSAVTLHGVTIPADSPVLLITGAANHDERAYADPDRFDIDRPLQLSLGFGHGIHSCLGAALARLESRVAFEEIRQRWPRYTIDEAGLRRVQMANVAGFCNVPARSGPS
ncbi:MAG TPA: cytochrome P450 [Acidimicrobiia bacterium]|nr:cytochrome P450 [Acidimicrobiia bacterium]